MVLREKVILELVKNAKQSDSRLAKKLGCAQSTVFRIRKQLEKDNVIWGYSTIVDWTKLGYSMYVITIRTKPPTKEGTGLVVKGIIAENAKKFGVSLLDIMMLFGEFEWCLLVAAPKEQNVHNYINFLRERYHKFIEGRPLHAKVMFNCVQQGQKNPTLDDLEKLGLETTSSK